MNIPAAAGGILSRIRLIGHLSTTGIQYIVVGVQRRQELIRARKVLERFPIILD